MKQIKKKLHSNTGASIMLALALTLICLMVSSVIVAAAASGAYRNQQELKSQQAYLAITSAAQYIAENLNTSSDYKFCGVHYSGETACNRYRNYVPENVKVGGATRNVYRIPTPYAYVTALAGIDVLDFYLVNDGDIFRNNPSEKKVLETETSFTGIFQDMMKEAVTSVYERNEEYSKEFVISITDNMDNRDERIPGVKCKFKMDKEYQVEIIVGFEIVVKKEGEDKFEASHYTLSVDLPAFTTENPNGVKRNETCDHRCIYEYIDVDGDVKVEEKTLTFSHEVNNSTTTVNWGAPVINRGGSGL